MVLQSKRANIENTPPTPQILINGKPAASHLLRSSTNDAARRRRVRTNGGPRSHKYLLEQAKRRSEKSSGTLRIQHTIPASRSTTDVEMQDAQPIASTSTIPVTLPKYLGRPDFREITQEALRAVEPEFADVDIAYLRDRLEETGPEMLKILGSVKANPSKDMLPKEYTVKVHDTTFVPPSHMLAVYGPPPKRSPTERRKVTLYPVHSIVLAAYCAKLPAFGPGSPPSTSNEISLPVRPICLPSPETYPQLSSYLYTKDTGKLLRSVIPCCPPADLETNGSQIPIFATKLAGTYTVQALLQHTVIVHGLWQNACAFGIFDDGLWDTLDLAWQVLLTAIAIGTGNPSDMISSQHRLPTPPSSPLQ